MKTLFKALIVSILAMAMIGCERGLSEREKECFELTQDRNCIGEVRHVEMERMDYDANNLRYGPTQPGTYQNYYGHPQHGYWNDRGQYIFNDPYSQYAVSTNSFLLGAGLGGLGAYMLTKNSNRTSWSKKYPGGYKKTTHVQKTYVGKGGKTITKAEYNKRAAQSRKDKAAHKAKLASKKSKVTKRKTALEAQKKRTAAKKNVTKPTASKYAKFSKPTTSKYAKSSKPTTSKYAKSSSSRSSSSKSKSKSKRR